jgi:hypothetical protein
VKTKVLMLSATPVNNRFNDLRNQLALAYEGESETLSKKLKTGKSVEEIFRAAQTAFNTWAKLPPAERTARAILDSLDFDFFELLDSVTIARSRKHIQTFYDTKDIGPFPERRKPLSFHCALTTRADVPGFNQIFAQLSMLKLAVYAPVSYILPSRLRKYEEMYDTEVSSGGGKLRQIDRERSLQALMVTNLLKRLESSVQAFRMTLESLRGNHEQTLAKIQAFIRPGPVMPRSVTAPNPSTTWRPMKTTCRPTPATTLAAKSRSAWPTWTCRPGSANCRPTCCSSMPAGRNASRHARTRRQAPAPQGPRAGQNRPPDQPRQQKGADLHRLRRHRRLPVRQPRTELLAGQGLHTAKVTGKGAPKSTLKKGLRLSGAADAVLAALQGKGRGAAGRARRGGLADRHGLHL